MLATDKINSRQLITDLILIALVFGLFYAIWIGSYALFTPDEGRYSEVAREMVATGDYITPRLNGVAFLDKPALYYWLQASAIRWFGIKEWALRLWPSIIGILGCLITYAAGYTLFNRRTGILAAIMLATYPLYYGAAHYANLDLEVAVLISQSLLFFLMAIQDSAKRFRTPLLFTAYFFAGLAFLTKGLIGLAFPAMIIGAWILLLNRWSLLKQMHIFGGLLLFSAIALPWYYLAQKANPEFLHFFFVTQQVTRFLTKATFNSQAASWFYVAVIFLTCMPWSVFIIQTFNYNLKLIWKNRRIYQNELFLILWFSIIFIFFSIPKSKTVGYIIPVLPTLSLLTARYLDTHWDKNLRGIFSARIIFVGIGIITFFTCLLLPQFSILDLEKEANPYLYTAGTIFLSGALLTLASLREKSARLFFIILTITASAFLLTLTASSHIINTKTIKPLVAELKTILQPGDEVATYLKYYQDLPIYLGQRVTVVADWQAKDIAYNDNWLREMWYGMPFQDTSAWLIQEDTFWTHWNSNKRIFAFLNKSYLRDFDKRAEHHFYTIGEYKDVILVSNRE